MITKCTTAAILALCSTTALATSQTPQNPSQQTAPRPGPQMPAPTAVAGQTTTVLAGCLYREARVPGRSPNVAERAGVEAYILADATMPAAQGTPGTTPRATGTSGTMPASGNRYKVENIADERLKALVGKRVEVTGRIDPELDQISLPEFEASSIRAITGTCPATPAPGK